MAGKTFDFPSNFPIVDDTYCGTVSWLKWFTWAHNGISAIYGSGTTADRPTVLLWIGRPYFDTTLGKPIWLKTARPVVWVDATGASV